MVWVASGTIFKVWLCLPNESGSRRGKIPPPPGVIILLELFHDAGKFKVKNVGDDIFDELHSENLLCDLICSESLESSMIELDAMP